MLKLIYLQSIIQSFAHSLIDIKKLNSWMPKVMDFDQFFDQWYYGEGYPIYNIEYYNHEGTTYLTSLQSTSSSTPFFEMLLDLRLHFLDGTDTLITIYQDETLENFSVTSGKEVFHINVDPNNWTMEQSSFSVGIIEKQTPISFSLGQSRTTEDITLYFSNKEFSEKNIIITDISGHTVYNEKTANSVFKVNTSFLSNGIYIVRANDGVNSFVRRFVK